jgi:superfamily I DNA/RNA helicase
MWQSAPENSAILRFYTVQMLKATRLERAFLRYRVPYQIIGGVRFYDRKEIKDVVAYLRLIYQPQDRMSFSRIANVPVRSVGAMSLEKFLHVAIRKRNGYYHSSWKMSIRPVLLPTKAKSSLLSDAGKNSGLYKLTWKHNSD